MAKKRIKTKAKRRFYKRKGFWIFLLFCGVLGAAVCYEGMRRLEPYRRQAAAIDLSTIDDVEEPSLILDRREREIGRMYVQNRSKITIEEVPQKLIDALLAQEDQRFFEHDGVDWMGVARAFYLNLKAGEVTQGASTITMQLARNAFDLKRKAEQLKQEDFERKIVEAFLALRIEETLRAQRALEFGDPRECKKAVKREVLEYYLNRIPFGSGYYGVRSAALGYFGREPMDLTVEQCASLVACVKNPAILSPLRNPEVNRKARNHVLNRMLDENMITDSEWMHLTSLPLEVDPKPIRRGVSHFYGKVAREARERVGIEALAQGGYRIYTTIDRDLQVLAQEALSEQLNRIESTPGYAHPDYADFEPGPGKETPYLQGAVLMTDSSESNVLAYVGGRDFSHSQYDFIEDGRRPLGTAFLPLIYAAALEEGMHPCHVVLDEPMDNRSVMVGGREGILGEWGMETAKPRYEGRITCRRSLAASKIAASIRLGREVGLERVAEQAERFGFAFESGELLPRLLIGWEPVSLPEALHAYTAFSREGRVPRRMRFIERIENAEGEVVYRSPEAEDTRRTGRAACSAETAYQIHSMLRDALDRGNLAGEAGDLAGAPFRGAAKTGTTHSFSDGWCLGYNGKVSLGIWIGFHQGQEGIHENAFGRLLAFRPWRELMNLAGRTHPGEPVERPGTLEPVTVCSRSGLLATRYCYESAGGDGPGGTLRYMGYTEYLRKDRPKLGLCDVHGSGGVGTDQILAQYGPEGGPGVPDQQVTVSPIHPKAQALLGEDPYNSELVTLAPDDEEVDRFVHGERLSLDFIVPGEEEARLRLPRPEKIVIETDSSP